jgi:hypothetical protein
MNKAHQKQTAAAFIQNVKPSDCITPAGMHGASPAQRRAAAAAAAARRTIINCF